MARASGVSTATDRRPAAGLDPRGHGTSTAKEGPCVAVTLETIRDLAVSSEISPADLMARASRRHYFFTGRTNLFSIVNILNVRAGYLTRTRPIRRLLDYGCGYGRTTRWLRAALPNIEISVTDVDRTAAAWTAETFGCKAIDTELAANAFDFIWVGSVFTHLAEDIAKALLDRLLAALTANGVLAITTHGRVRIARAPEIVWDAPSAKWMSFHLDKAHFDELVAGYHRGYGYVDYPSQPGYGISVVPLEWYSKHALASEEFIQIFCQEKAENHQDVSAFMNLNVATNVLGPLF
jgi:SAM-dependent methyltransferase